MNRQIWINSYNPFSAHHYHISQSYHFTFMYQQCMYIIRETEKFIHSSAHMNRSVICFCFDCPIMKIRYIPVSFLYSVIIIYYLLLENDCNFFFNKPAKIDYFEYKACQVKSFYKPLHPCQYNQTPPDHLPLLSWCATKEIKWLLPIWLGTQR